MNTFSSNLFYKSKLNTYGSILKDFMVGTVANNKLLLKMTSYVKMRGESSMQILKIYIGNEDQKWKRLDLKF